MDLTSGNFSFLLLFVARDVQFFAARSHTTGKQMQVLNLTELWWTISSIPRPGADNSHVYFGEWQRGDDYTFGLQALPFPRLGEAGGGGSPPVQTAEHRSRKQASISEWSNSKRTA